MGRTRDWTDKKLHDLGKDLIKHVQEDGIYHISSFFPLRHITQQNFYDLVKRYKIFSDYHKEAVAILANKLMRAAIEKSPNQWVIKTYLPRYMNDRDTLEEELARDELIKAKAKIKALKNELSSRGEVAEYIKSQKLTEIMTQ